jgi:hypothetical protein
MKEDIRARNLDLLLKAAVADGYSHDELHYIMKVRDYVLQYRSAS